MRTLFLGMAVLTIGGCMSVDAERIESWGSSAKGFRYYMPEPYLHVQKTKPSPVRLDIGTGSDAELRLAVGNKSRLILGKLVGLEHTTPLTVKLDQQTFLDFGDPQGAQVHEKSGVKAGQDGLVPIEVVLRAPLPTDATARIGFSVAWAGGELAKGWYVLTRKEPNAIDHAFIGRPSSATAVPDGSGYTMTIIYLPNPNKIIGVEVQDGIGGTANLDLKLKDGWMFTSVGTNVDTQADETIQAAGEFVANLAKLVPEFAALSTDGGTGASPATADVDLSGLYAPVYEKSGAIVKFKRLELER